MAFLFEDSFCHRDTESTDTYSDHHAERSRSIFTKVHQAQIIKRGIPFAFVAAGLSFKPVSLNELIFLKWQQR